MNSLALTYFKGLRDPNGRRVRTTWSKLVERLSVPRTSADKHDVPGLSLASFAGDRRALANVEQVFAIGLDLDEGVSWPVVRDRFSGCASFVHSTWSSTDSDPRARVFLLLSRPVTSEEYRLAYAYVTAKVEAGGLVVDRAASDPSRFSFLRCAQPSASFVSYVGIGHPIDADAAIDAAPRPAPYVPAPRSSGVRSADGYARARAYLHKCPGAVAGSGGSTATFLIAQRLVRGFALSVEDSLHLLASEWNDRCCPPWSERDLRRKVEEAERAGRMQEGDLLARDRQR